MRIGWLVGTIFMLGIAVSSYTDRRADALLWIGAAVIWNAAYFVANRYAEAFIAGSKKRQSPEDPQNS